MKILQGDRQKVVRWINHQFEHNRTFPSKCCRQRDSESDRSGSISPQHVRAYREWGITPSTRAALNGWVEQWLDEQEQQQLIEGIRNN